MTREDNPHLTEYGNGWEHGYQDALAQVDSAIMSVLEEAEQRRNNSDYPESKYGQHLDGQARGAADALAAVRSLADA